jgi:hypothetical protein
MPAQINLEWFDQAALRQGAAESTIHGLEQSVGFTFPEIYAGFLRRTDGYEGLVGDGYISLWATADLIAANKDYGFGDFVSGYFGIGSDGGGESFGFDSTSGKFFMVPFISSGWSDSIPVGEGFNEFIERLSSGKLFEHARNG